MTASITVLANRTEGGTEQAVVDRTDDGHGTDADCQECRDEAFDESRVTATARLLLEPVPETLHAVFEVDGFTDDCTTDEIRKHTVRPDERHSPISADLQHLFDRSRQTEEYDRHSAGHHDGLLETL